MGSIRLTWTAANSEPFHNHPEYAYLSFRGLNAFNRQGIWRRTNGAWGKQERFDVAMNSPLPVTNDRKGA